MNALKNSIILLAFIACFFIIGISAAPAAEYDHEYTAIQYAVNQLITKGCKEVSITRKSRYAMEETEGGYTMKARVLVVECVNAGDNPAIPTAYQIKWQAPSTREDGSPLAPGDVKGYVVSVNGVDQPIVKAPPLVVELEQGVYVVRAKTIDTNDQESKWSDAVELVVP